MVLRSLGKISVCWFVGYLSTRSATGLVGLFSLKDSSLCKGLGVCLSGHLMWQLPLLVCLPHRYRGRQRVLVPSKI